MGQNQMPLEHMTSLGERHWWGLLTSRTPFQQTITLDSKGEIKNRQTRPLTEYFNRAEQIKIQNNPLRDEE
eukprot:UN02891